MNAIEMSLTVEQWPLKVPFRISGYLFACVDTLTVRLNKQGCVGQGETGGVYYLNDKPANMLQQLEGIRRTIEAGISRDELQHLMPPCGARNALDCALWDLDSKLTGQAAWQLAGLALPKALVTTFTCGAEEPETMAACARGYDNARAIKIKLTGDPVDADRVRAVREARRDVWLGVDANQGFTRASLAELIPVLVAERVALIEQPFPVGEEALLDGFQSPIPIAADESAQGISGISSLADRFDVINIKLDKCGGLTEGLALARLARELGLDTMVGNMLGTSLAMAPAFLLGQLCQIVDLDGPALLREDREHTVRYANGAIECPERLWGYA